MSMILKYSSLSVPYTTEKTIETIDSWVYYRYYVGSSTIAMHQFINVSLRPYWKSLYHVYTRYVICRCCTTRWCRSVHELCNSVSSADSGNISFQTLFHILFTKILAKLWKMQIFLNFQKELSVMHVMSMGSKKSNFNKIHVLDFKIITKVCLTAVSCYKQESTRDSSLGIRPSTCYIPPI